MKIETIKKIIYGAKVLMNDHKEAQKICKTKIGKYLPIYDELLAEAYEYENKLNSGLLNIDVSDCKIRYIKFNRDISTQSLKYLFSLGVEPSKLYKEIPVDEMTIDNWYDTCYIDSNNKILKRKRDDPPMEILYFYENNIQIRITTREDDDKISVQYYKKIEYDEFGRIISLKQLATRSSAIKDYKLYKSGRMPLLCGVETENYIYEDGRLKEFCFEYCYPYEFFTHSINNTHWDILNIRIILERDSENNPTSYMYNLSEWGFGVSLDEQKHTINKRQIAKIKKLDR